MVKDITEEMGKQIEKCTWLDSYTKQGALAKVSVMKTFVGFPDWYSNAKHVEEYYRDVSTYSKN